VRWKPRQWLEKHSGEKVWAVQRCLNGMSKLTENKKRRDRCFLCHQGDCSQRICPGRPNSQFCILLWHFTMNAVTLVTKELAVAAWQCTTSFFLFHQGIFYQKQHDCRPSTTLLTWVVPLKLLSVFLIEDNSEMPPFWHNWGDRDRITGSAKHPHIIWLPGCIKKKKAETLETVHIHGRGLLQWWRRPVGPKLVFDQLAEAVPEIMDFWNKIN
jgi:hypothetical protein